MDKIELSKVGESLSMSGKWLEFYTTDTTGEAKSLFDCMQNTFSVYHRLKEIRNVIDDILLVDNCEAERNGA